MEGRAVGTDRANGNRTHSVMGCLNGWNTHRPVSAGRSWVSQLDDRSRGPACKAGTRTDEGAISFGALPAGGTFGSGCCYFITLLGGAAQRAARGAGAAGGKAPDRVPGPRHALIARSMVRPLVQRRREPGWIEGHTVAIQYRWAEGPPSASSKSQPNSSGARFMSLSRRGLPEAWLRSRRHRHPHRFAAAGDPVGTGLVASRRDRAATSPACRSADRSCWQTARSPARGHSRSPRIGDVGQCRHSPRRGGTGEVQAPARTLGLDFIT